MVNSSRIVTIKTLGVEFASLDVDLAVKLDQELDVWASRLHGWISVIMDGPTSYMLQLSAINWQQDYEEELLSEAYAEGRLYEPRELTEWQWRHALEHVAAGDRPHTSRLLLATAMTHMSNKDHRAAILDSATAAELTLVTAITKQVRIQGGGAAIAELLLKGKTLGVLVGLARDLSIPVPPDVTNNLVATRNRVMHTGYEATEAMADAAVKVARGIVSRLDPFPFHCDEEARSLLSLDEWREATSDDPLAE